MNMRLTPRQREFILSIYDPEEPVAHWECFAHERRPALATHKKGLVEFEDGVRPDVDEEWFMARLTEDGRRIADKLAAQAGNG